MAALMRQRKVGSIDRKTSSVFHISRTGDLQSKIALKSDFPASAIWRLPPNRRLRGEYQSGENDLLRKALRQVGFYVEIAIPEEFQSRSRLENPTNLWIPKNLQLIAKIADIASPCPMSHVQTVHDASKIMLAGT